MTNRTAETRLEAIGEARLALLRLGAWIGWPVVLLWALARVDVIDFHVCIKAPGHCKIIDPTVQQ